MSVDYEALKRSIFGNIGIETYRQMELAERLEENIRPYKVLQKQIDELTGASRGLNIYAQAAEALKIFDKTKYLDNIFELGKLREQIFGKGYSSANDAVEKIRSKYADIQKNLGVQGSLQNYRNSIQDQLSYSLQIDKYISSSHKDLAAALAEIQKPFKQLGEDWDLPNEITNKVGVLNTLQEQLRTLRAPTLDWASAATLSEILGTDGILSQLEKLGIDEDGELAEEKDVQDASERGIGLSRRTMDLITLFSIVWTIFFTDRQEISSAEWQNKVDGRFNELTAANQLQFKQLESLARLIEIAIEKEAEKSEVRYVVHERVASVRARPGGGAVESNLLPNEVVLLLSNNGKWVQVRYYHWIDQEYKSGWVLKKYLRRVPSSHLRDDTSL